jgi:hypothetical protein
MEHSLSWYHMYCMFSQDEAGNVNLRHLKSEICKYREALAPQCMYLGLRCTTRGQQQRVDEMKVSADLDHAMCKI